MPVQFAPIPRAPFAIAMSIATLFALLAGVGVARGVGGDGMTLAAIAATIFAGASLCILPLMGPPLVKPDNWGMFVLGVSAARTVLALAALIVLVEVMGLDRKSVAYGVLAGVMTLTIAEAGIAVWLLTQRERAMDAARRKNASTTTTSTTKTTQHHGSLA